jgi:murein DD-endopeptidase MepM/ murein hydrolase activator NlpD
MTPKFGRPVKTNYITQGFGLEKTIKSMLPFYQSLGLEAHNGRDYLAKDGEKVYWNCLNYEGIVLETHFDIKGGLGVVVGIDTPEGCYKVIFWHLKSIAVKPNQVLSTGQLIGRANNTGYSTGTHLHFGLKKTNKNWQTVDYQNNYRGAIDPEPYLDNVYVKDLIDTQTKIVRTIKGLISLLEILISKKK